MLVAKPPKKFWLNILSDTLIHFPFKFTYAKLNTSN